jgi:hypothetical protein
LEVFRRLLGERREAVLASEPELFGTVAAHAQYELVAPGLYANMAWIPQYHLKEIQRVVDEFDLADDLQVKFATNETEEEMIESWDGSDDRDKVLTDQPSSANTQVHQ